MGFAQVNEVSFLPLPNIPEFVTSNEVFIKCNFGIDGLVSTEANKYVALT